MVCRNKNNLKSFGDKLVVKVPLSWKKSFISGIVIPHKLRSCGDCANGILCEKCEKLVIQRKELSAKLELMKNSDNSLIYYNIDINSELKSQSSRD